MILILAAMSLGMWFAERLSRPVGRSDDSGTARRRQAIWRVQVIDDGGNDDEIAMLGRYFNQMTRQLKGPARYAAFGKHPADRTAVGGLFDSVLSSVTSGVVGAGPRWARDLREPLGRAAVGLVRATSSSLAFGHRRARSSCRSLKLLVVQAGSGNRAGRGQGYPQGAVGKPAGAHGDPAG